MNIQLAAKNIAAELHRQYWLLRLRRAEQRQEKELANTAAILRRMCGQAAGPHLKKVYEKRVHVLTVIGQVVSPRKSREDLTVPEIQLVMFEFLRRRINNHPEELLA